MNQVKFNRFLLLHVYTYSKDFVPLKLWGSFITSTKLPKVDIVKKSRRLAKRFFSNPLKVQLKMKKDLKDLSTKAPKLLQELLKNA